MSSPSHLYVLAEKVAAHRQLTAERVLELTSANAQHLYHRQYWEILSSRPGLVARSCELLSVATVKDSQFTGCACSSLL